MPEVMKEAVYQVTIKAGLMLQMMSTAKRISNPSEFPGYGDQIMSQTSKAN